jgi:hypothetical protein
VAVSRIGKELKRGSENLAGAISGGIIGWRKKMMMWTDQWGPLVMERKQKVGYRFRRREDGPRARFLVGPKGFPGSISFYFLFFSFLFSVFFI